MHQPLDFAAEVGRDRGGSSGDQGIEDTALRSPATVPKDDLRDGVVLRDRSRKTSEERGYNLLFKALVQRIARGDGVDHSR
jgi:hypothetical protein